MLKDTADNEQRMAGKSENVSFLLLQILLHLPDSYHLSVMSTMHAETQHLIVVLSAKQQIFNSL